MPAPSFGENPYITLAGDKFNLVLGKLKSLPLLYWRNGLFLFAAIWLCHSLASLFWVIVGAPDLPQPKILATPLSSTQQASSASSVNLSDLQALKLFGDGSTAPELIPEEKPEDENVDDAQRTRLNVKLQGVIASSDAKRAGAIIEEGSKQGFYLVGDELTSNRGVKLAKVFEQKVILDNRGTFESLFLYSEADFKKSQSLSPTRRSVPLKKSFSRDRSVVEADEENVIRRTARLDQMPKSVGDVVRFSVHRENGKMVGYRIRPGKDKELFEQLGLKMNDIVISVNGIDVDDPKKIRSVYKEVKTAPEAQLTVLRDGQTFSINISLDTGG